jgi:hypothetical protein
MKILLQSATILLLMFTSACSNEATENNPSENAPKTPEQASANTQTANSSNDDGIVGDWELVGFVGDTNDNLQIDEEERKNLKTPSYKDYMTLNRDGSGLFTVAKMEGRYEIKTDESNGRKIMTWYDKGNGPHRVGSIMKVTKDELTIKEPGGNGLFLWKRI